MLDAPQTPSTKPQAVHYQLRLLAPISTDSAFAEYASDTQRWVVSYAQRYNQVRASAYVPFRQLVMACNSAKIGLQWDSTLDLN